MPVSSRQERYRRRYREHRPEWRDSLARLIHLVDEAVSAESRVLDIGCGHADFLAGVFSRTSRAVGLDPDLAALRGNTTVDAMVCAAAGALPFAAESFDLVVSAWVIEHLADPAVAFSEVRRVLRPGGRLIFLTPNLLNYAVWPIRLVPNRLHRTLVRRLYGRDEADTYPVRYRMNSPHRVRSVLAGAGLCEVALYVNGDPTYLAFNEPLYRLACLLERLHDLPVLRRCRVHLIGIWERETLTAHEEQ